MRLPMSLVVAGLLSGNLVLAASPQSQPAPPAKPIPTQPFARPSIGLTLEYPKKDWRALAVGAGSSTVLFVQNKGEATIAVEALKVPPLGKDDITDQTANLEIDGWKARRPQASGFVHQFIDVAGSRAILIDFTQPGAEGPEHVRMYTMPRGSDWFRVVCTTSQAGFEKYKDTCHTIALSLKSAPPTS